MMLRLAAALAFLLAPAAAIAQASPSPATSATRYDVMGRVTGTISSDPDAVGVGNPFLAVRNTYDPAGRLTKVETGTLAAWQSEAIAPASWTGFTIVQSVATLYDSMSRKTRDTLREGSAGTIRTVTQYSYDAAGRLECTAVRMNPAVFGSLPASACTHSTYDPALGRDRITRDVYDAAGQRLQHRVAVGVTGEEAAEATWAYNLNGQVTTLIDGNGNRAELRYDGHGRQDRWTFPSTTRPVAYNDATQATALATAGSVNANDYEGYSYDANGNRTNLRKRDTRNIVFAYDALNRVTSKNYSPTNAGTPVFYSYNLQGLQLTARFTSQSGEGLTNAYDGFGRLATSSTSQGGTTRTLAFQYDRNGNRTRITHPDATWFQYAYDWLNRVNTIREPDNDMIIYAAYDVPGRPSSVSFLGGGMATNLTYDGVSRLSGLAHQLFGTAQDVTWTYTRNAASQLASAARSNDAYAWTAHYTVNRPYTTNGLNQYSAAGQALFGYDANGNLTSDGTNNYTYDIENRLVSMNGVMTLIYDPLGRLYQTAGGPSGTTRYLYDGDALVAEYNANGTLRNRYVHGVGADVPMIWYVGTDLNTRRHLHDDHQGSIVAVGVPGAPALAINAYDEYGIPAPANVGLFQYTGQIWLADLGMYHYKARIYSPTLGRFLQTDPVGYDDQFNLYAYIGNDPINRIDPSGMCDPADPDCITDPDSSDEAPNLPTTESEPETDEIVVTALRNRTEQARNSQIPSNDELPIVVIDGEVRELTRGTDYEIEELRCTSDDWSYDMTRITIERESTRGADAAGHLHRGNRNRGPGLDDGHSVAVGGIVQYMAWGRGDRFGAGKIEYRSGVGFTYRRLTTSNQPSRMAVRDVLSRMNSGGGRGSSGDTCRRQ